MARRFLTAREQVELLEPWLHTAAGFDPMEVTHRLKNDFYDWHEGLSEDQLHPDADQNNPLGHWPTIENFLKDKYPAAHRGFASGLEDASHFLRDPSMSYHQPMHMSDDPYGEGESHFDTNPPAPYSADPKTIQGLGYDPEEIAAGMVMLHNKAHSGRGNAYAEDDKDRLVDIFNKRQKMQRDYEQRAGRH